MNPLPKVLSMSLDKQRLNAADVQASFDLAVDYADIQFVSKSNGVEEYNLQVIFDDIFIKGNDNFKFFTKHLKALYPASNLTEMSPNVYDFYTAKKPLATDELEEMSYEEFIKYIEFVVNTEKYRNFTIEKLANDLFVNHSSYIHFGHEPLYSDDPSTLFS